MSQNFCAAAACAKKSLDEAICSIISASALSQYATIVKHIKDATSFDLDAIFELIALLSVICFVGNWIQEIIRFITHSVPKFVKRLLHGKFSFCLTNCDGNDESEPHKSEKSHKSEKPHKSEKSHKSYKSEQSYKSNSECSSESHSDSHSSVY